MIAIELVWFKRDLRIHDHQALSVAAQRANERGSFVLPLYVIEDNYWGQADTSVRQFEFLRGTLMDLQAALARLGQKLAVERGDSITVLENLRKTFAIRALYSHEETGNRWTFNRDLKVAAWCKTNAIAWHEFRQFGVVRGLKKRIGWATQWEEHMGAPLVRAPLALAALPELSPCGLNFSGNIPSTLDLPALNARNMIGGSSVTDAVGMQGGRRHARLLLSSFFTERGRNYQQEMSSPISAEQSCSRLSAHLSLGNISMRELYQQARKFKAHDQENARSSSWSRTITSFSARLHWHCHFIQKLESEPAIEFRNINSGYDGMREPAVDLSLIAAWCKGETGWPFVDACMRMLNSTGWINFRMRAMLVAVSSYHLWQHWRKPGLHLARQFVDYEPGIHWSQVQMQSGVTGINIPRIYNPIKQSLDQDPQGTFIRRWLPELKNVSDSYIHRPWLMPSAMQQRTGAVIGTHYPSPVRDPIQAAREAKDKLGRWCEKLEMRELNAAVLRKHGSKKRNLASAASNPQTKTQLPLF